MKTTNTLLERKEVEMDPKQERNDRGSTDRIRKLRQISTKGCSPKISMERAVLLTEAYKKYEGKVSKPVLRGLAFKHIMENRSLYLEKGSLIVGEKGHEPWAAPTFPELC